MLVLELVGDAEAGLDDVGGEAGHPGCVEPVRLGAGPLAHRVQEHDALLSLVLHHAHVVDLDVLGGLEFSDQLVIVS